MDILLYTWSQIWKFIIESSSVASAIGMVLMTYYVYRLTSKANKIDRYFKNITEIYFKIEDDFRLLTIQTESCDITTKDKEVLREQCYKRISVNCKVMQYYITRIPVYYDKNLIFWELLGEISKHPDSVNRFDDFVDMFQDFCCNLRETKSHIHTMSFNYDGGPIN